MKKPFISFLFVSLFLNVVYATDKLAPVSSSKREFSLFEKFDWALEMEEVSVMNSEVEVLSEQTGSVLSARANGCQIMIVLGDNDAGLFHFSATGNVPYIIAKNFDRLKNGSLAFMINSQPGDFHSDRMEGEITGTMSYFVPNENFFNLSKMSEVASIFRDERYESIYACLMSPNHFFIFFIRHKPFAPIALIEFKENKIQVFKTEPNGVIFKEKGAPFSTLNDFNHVTAFEIWA